SVISPVVDVALAGELDVGEGQILEAAADIEGRAGEAVGRHVLGMGSRHECRRADGGQRQYTHGRTHRNPRIKSNCRAKITAFTIAKALSPGATRRFWTYVTEKPQAGELNSRQSSRAP